MRNRQTPERLFTVAEASPTHGLVQSWLETACLAQETAGPPARVHTTLL